MVTTNLAQSKRLKELGFPQEHYGCEYYCVYPLATEGPHPANEAFKDREKYNCKIFAAPGLSELIQWLGDDFDRLERSEVDRKFFAAGYNESGTRQRLTHLYESPIDALVALAEAVKGGK